LDELLGGVDVVVDCTPKKFGGENTAAYRRAGVKFIVEGARNMPSLATPSLPKPIMQAHLGGKRHASSLATQPRSFAR
jgi:hypothetical protein